MWRLRLPASLPYLFPAFKIAALASIIGAIVGEISAAQSDGIGYLILDFASKYSTGPERLYGLHHRGCSAGAVRRCRDHIS